MEIRSTTTLDPDVWGNLPIHVLEHIVAFLPIPAQIRFRTVSKHFNTWLSSPEFSELSKELPVEKFVNVLWRARQAIGLAPSDLVNYTQRGGFASLQRPSRIFNADCLRPYCMTKLVEWGIDIEATTRCYFVCKSCEAKARSLLGLLHVDG